MGNNINVHIFPQFINNLGISSDKFHHQVNQKYIIKELLTNSTEHHQEIISNIHKFKQLQCSNIVKLLDSHTVQAHHLCSVVTHIYVFFQKPNCVLKEYIKRELELHNRINNRTLRNILVGALKGLYFLTSQGYDIEKIDMQQLYIDQDQRGQITVKMFNPYFLQTYYDEQRHDKNAITDIGNMLRKYLNEQEHEAELIETIILMSQGRMSLQNLQIKYLLNEKKKYRGKIKLTKNATNRSRKQERFSTVSNGSSLCIDGGKDESQFIFKQFYQNFDHSISQISFKTEPFINDGSLQIDSSHQFPKKYNNSRAFKKTLKSSKSIQTCQSDPKILKNQQLVKNKSEAINLFDEKSHILLSSAKLVESFIKQL